MDGSRSIHDSRTRAELTLSGNGKSVLATGTEGGVNLWDIATGKRITHLKSEQNIILSLALSQDKRLALVGGNGTFDDNVPKHAEFPHNLELWDTTEGKLIRHLFGHKTAVYSAAFSGDGKMAISASGDNATDIQTVKLWDLRTSKVLREYDFKKGGRVCFSHDDKWMYSLGTDLRAWDIESGTLIHLFDKLAHRGKPMGFTPDKRYYLSRERWEESDMDGSLTLWELLKKRQ